MTPFLAMAVGLAELPESFEDRLVDHMVSWKMIKVPDGEIEIDGKRHKIRNFAIGETEVTWNLFEVWALRLDLSQSEQAQGVDATSRPSKPYSAIFINFGHHGYPAIAMSAENAKAFCKWLSEKTKRKYRLPTEAEWEYAARAGAKQPSALDESAWFWSNADDVTHPVAKKKPNAWGLFDVLGNVAEWATSGDAVVVRGGSWRTKEADLSFSTRELPSPKWNESDPQQPKSRWWLANGQFVGLRLACDL
jgi:formylglycine-generating enzyme required for sulfatase activity